MNTQIPKAVREAMNMLRTQNIAGATAAIQNALSGRASSAPERDENAQAQSPRRSLGDVIKLLRAGRATFASTMPHQKPLYEEAGAIAPDQQFSARVFRSAMGSLNYKVYIPQDIAHRELSLVLMLHGCTQNPDDFARGTQMNHLANEHGLIVVYPHQPHSANAQGCWNWFDPRHQQRGRGEPAVLAGLAQDLAKEFGIAKHRIFAAGLSAGGAMADILATTYPEIFEAVAIHSGLPTGAANDVMSAFAAMKGNAKLSASRQHNQSRKIIFHGGSDATVHESNGERIFEHLRNDTIGNVSWSTDNMANGRSVTRSVVDDAAGNPIGEYWKIHGASHAWSGGDRSGTYTDPMGPDASKEMLRFFLNP